MALFSTSIPNSAIHRIPSPLFAVHSFSKDIDFGSSQVKASCVYKFDIAKAQRSMFLCKHRFPISCQRNISAYAGKNEPEKSLLRVIEIDKLIDKLRLTSEKQLPQVVAENILSFDPSFWMRLAARTEQCESKDDKEDLKELSNVLMTMVERLVNRTTEKIDSSTEVLKEIIKPITVGNEEIIWPPRDPKTLLLVKEELYHREENGQLDEGFLSEVSAQLRRAKADGDKPGLVAMLQKVLQFYASKILSRRSYVMKANEEEWNELLINGLIYGGGKITIEEFDAIVNKRVERTLIRTVNGSYQQRILCEYLKEIQARAHNLAEAFWKQKE
eukprot:TRINITY_DN5259_c0_g1_i1.p1 TRINITY_DN5259_c0_g1~~TRINITY_DN5259_c0_g1_i1.p1  ORF type:complete len:330 (-),score=83.28 TRINITY_DN5259_c0_g1_i1:357-1346(-)